MQVFVAQLLTLICVPITPMQPTSKYQPLLPTMPKLPPSPMGCRQHPVPKAALRRQMGGWESGGAIFLRYLEGVLERLRRPPLAILDAEHERRDWWYMVLDDDDDDENDDDADDHAEPLRVLS